MERCGTLWAVPSDKERGMNEEGVDSWTRIAMIQADSQTQPSTPRPNDGGQRAGGVTVVCVVVRAGSAVRSGGRVGRFWEETFGRNPRRNLNLSPINATRSLTLGWIKLGGGRWRAVRAVRCRCDV